MKQAEVEAMIRDIIHQNVGGTYDGRQKCAEQIMELFGYTEPKTSNPSPQAGETPLNYNSEQLIGSVQQRFNQLEHKNWNWSSFYNGWLEVRINMLKEIKG